MAYSTINKPSLHFNTVLYTGDGTSSNAITGVGFQPDLLWIKQRSAVRSHQLMDAVRGASVRLLSDSTAAESSSALTSFDSDGFTVDGSTLNGTNASGGTFVSWNWKADNTSGSSNTDGSITSTVSANTSSGFSIVTFTGTGSNATVGHGLGAAPKCMWLKGRSGATQWNIYNASLGANKHLNFDSDEAEQSYTNRFNDTDPTSTVFTVGTDAETNPSGGTMVAYCFAPVKGFSAFGKYTGNASTDGPFVYCGFKPALIILKTSNTIRYWNMQDTARAPYNPADTVLYPNDSAAESDGVSQWSIDFLSNGFKIRSSTAEQNGSGNTIIYMAFAEQTLVGTNGVPATAR